MLRAVPTSLFSWDFDIFRGDTRVAVVDLAWVREAATVTIDNADYTIGREGLLSGAFQLKKRGETVASAKKPSAFSRSFELRIGNEGYTLAAASPFTRRFVLRKGASDVGEIRPAHWFTRKAIVDLPKGIPLEVQVFLTWLVVILWRRQERSAAD